jgi:hypothetical protein
VSTDDRLGVTSRIRPAPGRKHRWRIDDTTTFPLPVIVDHMFVDPQTRAVGWHIEATIDLVDDEPALVRLDARAARGFDLVRLQREFRWASPLEIVTRSVPILLERGVDPFAFDLPLTGFPEAAELGRPSNEQLSDAFLEAMAREYLTRGRGYAKAIAAERHVSPRTVVSWIEKARNRGILTRVPQGGFGGEIVPKNARHSA